MTTTTPEVQYDFGATLRADEERRLFDVDCTLNMADGTSSTVSRTLSVVDAYAVCRRMGVLAPPITAASLARKVLGTFEATLQVRNPEAVAVSLDRRQFIWGDAEQERSSPVEELATAMELAPGAVTTVKIAVPFTTVPADVHDFTVVYLGTDPEGRIVHLEAGLDVPLPDHRTSGIRFGELAFSRISAVGFEKVFRDSTVVQLGAEQAVDPEIVRHSGHVILHANEVPVVLAEPGQSDCDAGRSPRDHGPQRLAGSTLAHVLAGREGYDITAGEVLYNGKDLLDMAPEERACEGVFLGVSISGRDSGRKQYVLSQVGPELDPQVPRAGRTRCDGFHRADEGKDANPPC